MLAVLPDVNFMPAICNLYSGRDEKWHCQTNFYMPHVHFPSRSGFGLQQLYEVFSKMETRGLLHILVRLHVWPRPAVSFQESSSSLRTDVNKAVKPVIVSCFFVSFTCSHLLRNVKQWGKTWEKDIFNVLHSKDAIKFTLKCLVMESTEQWMLQHIFCGFIG